MIVDGVYRTSDLILASVLSMSGFTPSLEDSPGSSGYNKVTFVFRFRDDDDPEYVEGLIEEMRRGECRVEPKRFAREMKHLRELLYDFLKVERGRLRLHQA